MEITNVLKQLSENGTKPVTQIEFHGEEVNLTTVMQSAGGRKAGKMEGAAEIVNRQKPGTAYAHCLLFGQSGPISKKETRKLERAAGV